MVGVHGGCEDLGVQVVNELPLLLQGRNSISWFSRSKSWTQSPQSPSRDWLRGLNNEQRNNGSFDEGFWRELRRPWIRAWSLHCSWHHSMKVRCWAYNWSGRRSFRRHCRDSFTKVFDEKQATLLDCGLMVASKVPFLEVYIALDTNDEMMSICL